MRAGEFADGAHVLRAKIDMASPNINMRDPVLYRIRHAHHHRTGDAWCIYPMYDYAHPLSDAIEGITHSLCTLEFEDHRPLYDWCIEQAETEHQPQQIEFARLNLNYTVMSKRKLLQLVAQKPRGAAGTTRACRPSRACAAAASRRNRSATSARASAWPRRRTSSTSGLLEHCVREDLNRRAPRAMAVLRPLKLVLTNYPEGQVEHMDVVNNPDDPARRHAQGAVLARDLHRARRLHGRPAEEVLPPGARARSAAAQRLPHHLQRGRQGRRRRDRRAALHLRPGHAAAATPRTAARSRRRCTGCRPRTPSPAPCGSTIGCSRPPIRTALPARTGVDFDACSTRRRSTALTGCKLEPSLAVAPTGHALPVRAAGLLLLPTPIRAPGAPVFNRTVTLKDAWARATARDTA